MDIPAFASNLKRDEIYTFMGGLFVASVWSLALGITRTLTSNEFLIYIIILWLLCTAILFLTIVPIYWLTEKYLKIKDYHPQELSLASCWNTKALEEYFITVHILLVVSLSTFYSLLSFFVKPFSSESFLNCTIIILAILIIVLSFYLFITRRKILLEFWRNERNGVYYLYDEKKYTEEIAIKLANRK